MNDNGTVNSQIVDSVSSVGTLITGQSPAQSFGMLDAVLLETLGMAMHNAVNRQQGGSVIGAAAVAAACARMLGAPLPLQPPPPPGPPPTPPVVNPLPGPPPTPPPPAAVIAAAFAEGEAAIQVLKAQAQSATTDGTQAQNDLKQLATDATASSTAGGTGATGATGAG
ncbi:MAG: RebB family R body protein [Nevskia sp.]|nr:RebB family R body protein [Nevskia sp.]